MLSARKNWCFLRNPPGLSLGQNDDFVNLWIVYTTNVTVPHFQKVVEPDVTGVLYERNPNVLEHWLVTVSNFDEWSLLCLWWIVVFVFFHIILYPLMVSLRFVLILLKCETRVTTVNSKLYHPVFLAFRSTFSASGVTHNGTVWVAGFSHVTWIEIVPSVLTRQKSQTQKEYFVYTMARI